MLDLRDQGFIYANKHNNARINNLIDFCVTRLRLDLFMRHSVNQKRSVLFIRNMNSKWGIRNTALYERMMYESHTPHIYRCM